MNDIDRMINDIQLEVDITRRMTGRDKFDERVMQAMRHVPRHAFVPDEWQDRAYDNGPLPIGHNQTISQPYIVALMTDLLEPGPEDVILEIGTGSGYQAAVLAQLVKKVYSLEIIPELRDIAQRCLQSLHYDNVEIHAGNGYDGLAEFAPYDGIIVTAAATHIPPALVDQLRPGGRLVIPVGPPYYHQELMLVKKDDAGHTRITSILGVAFVPMVDDRRQDNRKTEQRTLDNSKDRS